MADYQLTDKANAELDQIYEYSILNFGLKKPIVFDKLLDYKYNC